MIKDHRNKASTIEIVSPSQLILDIDEFFQLTRKLPSQSPILSERENKIFASLGIRKVKTFENFLISEVRLASIEDDINTRFQDGFDMEDELSTVRYPFNRTIRVRNKLENPTAIKEVLDSRVSYIKIGNYHILDNNKATIQRFNTSLLALSSTFEEPSRHR